MKKDWMKMAKVKLNEIPFGKPRCFANMSAHYKSRYSTWSIAALLAVARYIIPFAKKYWESEWNLTQAISQVKFGCYPYEACTPRLKRFIESWKDYQEYCFYLEVCRQVEINKEPQKESKFTGIESLWQKDDMFDDRYLVGIDWSKSSDVMLYRGEGEVTKALRETEEMLGIRPSGLSILKDSFGYPNGRNGARLKVDDYE